MRLRVTDNLSKLEIFAEDEEVKRILGGEPEEDGRRIKVAEIKNPVLMTDPYEIGRCDPVTRDILFQLYQSFPRITEYDGAECSWDPKIYRTVWCPSIDTIFFAAALRKKLAVEPLIRAVFGAETIRTVIDIGCGSGFLGKYAMKKMAASGSPVERLHFLDIDPNAIRCAMDNTEKERGDTAISYSLSRTGDRLEINGTHDLVICNPPYIPRPQTVSANPYEGLYLIKEILEKARNIISPHGFLITNFSSLCEREFKQWSAENNISYEVLMSKNVPLKVLPVISGRTRRSRDWMKYLKQRAGTGLYVNEEGKNGYRYWHTINIVLIEGGQ